MKTEYVKIAAWMTLPFLLAFLYELFAYGNASGNIGMGGLEIVFFLLYVALPMFVFGLITFIISIIKLWKTGASIKKEIYSFVTTLVCISALIFGVVMLSSHCSRSKKCSFIPKTVYR